MVKDVTIIGFIQRQMAVCLLLALAFSAQSHARDRGFDARENGNMLTQNHLATDLNQSRFQQPFVQPGGMYAPPTAKSATEQVTLWPGSVSYKRPVKFMKPYLTPELKLGMRYTYNFTFNLRSRDPAFGWKQIPDGWYLMTIAVILPENTTGYFSHISPALNHYDRYVTSTQLYVPVTGGVANRRIYLNFENLSATTIYNHMVVEFIPLTNDCSTRDAQGKVIHENTCIKTNARGEADPLRSKPVPRAGYKPRMCEIPFVPYLPADAATCNPDDSVTIEQLEDEPLSKYIAIAKSRKPKEKPVQAPTPREFADKYKLRIMSPDDPLIQRKMGHRATAERVREEISRILNKNDAGAISLDANSRWFIYGLCNLLVETNEAFQKTRTTDATSTNPAANNLGNIIQRCSYKPFDYFRMSKVTHLYNFDRKNAKAAFAHPLRSSLQTNFMVSRSHMTDVSGGVSTAQMGLKLLDAFGIGLTGLNYSITYSNSRSRSESTSMSNSIGLDFNLIGMTIPAQKFQRCMQVVPIRYSNSPFYNASSNARTNGLYICEDPSEKPTNVTETYAHIFVHSGDTSTVDAFDPLTQSVNLSVRGDRDISSFYALTRKAMRPDHNSQLQAIHMLPSAENYFKNTPPSDPRVIVNPVQFADESVPSLGALISFDYSEKFIDDEK